MEKIVNEEKYTAVEIGKYSELEKYEHSKAFLHDALNLSSMEISFTKYKPGEAIPFFHDHKNHEEVYVVISGSGEMQLDEKIIPMKEGTSIRVAPGVSRNLKNTGETDMIVMCAQAEKDSLKTPLNEDYKDRIKVHKVNSYYLSLTKAQVNKFLRNFSYFLMTLQELKAKINAILRYKFLSPNLCLHSGLETRKNSKHK